MIGIFDSGIGGVTVLKEVIRQLPNFHYLYYSDSKNNPYGDKDINSLNIITERIVEYLIKKGCSIIIIACNTASALCKDNLRKKFSVPIIAIEPAIKMVYDLKIDVQTLIMATSGTIKSENFNKLYSKYKEDNYKILECPGLADLIEKDDKKLIDKYLAEKLKGVKASNVILGCTHYPLIKEKIKKYLGDVLFFDGSVGVAKRVLEVVKKIDLKESEFKIEFIDSSNSKIKEERFKDILNK